MAAFPELKKVDFAQTQGDLLSLLQTVGDRVQALFQDFPNTSSLERIRLEALDRRGGVSRIRILNYQYLLAAHIEQEGIVLKEYRTDPRGKEIDLSALRGFFLITSGYASIPLYFHPLYQKDSLFRYLGREKADNRAHAIAFAQQPGFARLVGTFRSAVGTNQLWVQGIAWVDPVTSLILRMRTDILVPIPEAGVQKHTTEIQFKEVRFSQIDRTLWLPYEVRVNTSWMGRSFRNRHKYSAHRLFTVDATEGEKRTIVTP